MAKKLSPAQQVLVAAIAGKTLTYRIVSLWRGGVSTSSLVDVRIGGEKTEIKVRLSTIEALINSGHAILKSVNTYGNIHTVVLPCDNHATVPAQHETLEALKAENSALKAERKEIEMKQRTAGYTVESDSRLTVIGSKKWELYRKAAYILMTTSPDKIVDAEFAHHVMDIARLNCSSQPERDYWNDQKAWWGREIKRRREAEAPHWPESPSPAPEDPEAPMKDGLKVEYPEVFYTGVLHYEGSTLDKKLKACSDALTAWGHYVSAVPPKFGEVLILLCEFAEASSGLPEGFLEAADRLLDEREIAMGRCIPDPAHHEAPALSQETADAIEQRHNVRVDRASEMYTNDGPSHTNDYGETGWKLIPQEWIDEVATQS